MEQVKIFLALLSGVFLIMIGFVLAIALIAKFL